MILFIIVLFMTQYYLILFINTKSYQHTKISYVIMHIYNYIYPINRTRIYNSYYLLLKSLLFYIPFMKQLIVIENN